MIKWPKRYSWTDAKGISRLVRVLPAVGDPAHGDLAKESHRVEIVDVNTGKRFTNVLLGSLALIE